MEFQNLIYKIGKWLYNEDLARFDKDREKLIKGKQFPDDNSLSKNLEFVMNSFDGNKISLDSIPTKEEIDMAGINNEKPTSE